MPWLVSKYKISGHVSLFPGPSVSFFPGELYICNL